MLFWMRFPLLNAVVWMALTTHAAEGSNCTGNCRLHRFSGIALPIDDIQHKISIWQTGDAFIFFPHKKMEISARKEYIITTIPNDDKTCIVSPGLLEEPGHCYVRDEFDRIEVYPDYSLWRLDCKNDSCACQHHRLIGLSINKHFSSRVFWWPTQNISKVIVASNIYLNIDNDITLEVPSPPRWHDFFIGGFRDYGFRLLSSSLNVSATRYQPSVWIYGINDEGQKIPSYFALGCGNEPTEHPDETTEDNDKDQEMTKETYQALWFFLFAVAVVLS